MPKCNHCREHVSQEFQRVFSDGDGVVHACLNCSVGPVDEAMHQRIQN